MSIKFKLFLIISILTNSVPVFAINVFTDDQEENFVQTYSEKYNIPKRFIEKALEQAVYQPNSYQMQLPAGGSVGQPSLQSLERYKRQFIYPAMINRGTQFMCAHKDALRKAKNTYDVPPEVILGIIGVETRYGANTGHYRVLDALATIAFNAPRRVEYFQDELAKYLLMCYKNGWDPATIYGSIDGGMGIAQFMPSAYIDYAVSYTDDTPDLMVANDAILSIANYIKQHGWKPNEPVYINIKYNPKTCQKLNCNNRELTYPLSTWKQNGINLRNPPVHPSSMADLVSFGSVYNNPAWLALNNFFVIFAYNHSNRYTLTTYQLGKTVVAKGNKMGCQI